MPTRLEVMEEVEEHRDPQDPLEGCRHHGEPLGRAGWIPNGRDGRP